MSLAGWGRRRERERSEIRLKWRVGWGGRRSVSMSVHGKHKGARRRRNDMKYRGRSVGRSHDHFESLGRGGGGT